MLGEETVTGEICILRSPGHQVSIGMRRTCDTTTSQSLTASLSGNHVTQNAALQTEVSQAFPETGFYIVFIQRNCSACKQESKSS